MDNVTMISVLKRGLDGFSVHTHRLHKERFYHSVLHGPVTGESVILKNFLRSLIYVSHKGTDQRCKEDMAGPLIEVL